MRLLNPWHLAEALNRGALSERAKYRLILLATVVAGLVGTNLGILYSIGSRLLLPSATAKFVIGIAALWLAFRQNQRGDGRAFVERFVCLGAVISFWATIVYFGLYYFLAVILGVTTACGFVACATALRNGFWPATTVISLAYLVALWYFMTRAAQVRAPA